VSGPLAGIRVLDLSRVLAGPWATQLLGDYGAEVVKVERPGQGDDTRAWGPPWLVDDGRRESAYFLAANRNKRSIAIDLARSEGRDLLRRLAAEADVLIENFKAGTMRNWELDAVSLQDANPGLVYCSISAYAHDSSRAGEPGYDAMIQASGGLMSITGGADGGEPQKVGVAIADIMCGMYAASAIAAALVARERSGRGQAIEVPLYDSQVAWLANQAMNYLVGGEVPGRLGTAHPNIVPYQAFAASDGSFMLAVGNDRQFAACARCCSLPDLADDPRFRRNEDRLQNRDALVAVLSAAFRARSCEHWVRELTAAGVPASQINDLAAVFSSRYAEEREFVRHVAHRYDPALATVANPVRFSATPVAYDLAPPLLGEHTEAVLTDWLGYSADAVRQLRKTGAI